jgi:hypothetical protein
MGQHVNFCLGNNLIEGCRDACLLLFWQDSRLYNFPISQMNTSTSGPSASIKDYSGNDPKDDLQQSDRKVSVSSPEHES